MNRLLQEAAPLFNAKLSFKRDLSQGDESDMRQHHAVVLPRWDALLRSENILPDLVGRICAARDMAARLLVPHACCDGTAAKSKHLILRRSAQPAYYAPNGGARVETYGTGRRHFSGIEEGQTQLEARGVACMPYEPGAHNLGCQISHFSQCAGIIGVRGAEFANMIWLPEHARQIIFLSQGFAHSPPQRALAQLLGLHYQEIASSGESGAHLDIERIIDYF